MAFGDLLEQVGSTGRFQVVHVTLLCMPILMMASHNLLQNFVASVPPHFCSAHANRSALSRLSQEEVLLVTVPLDQQGRPQRCQRYASPRWSLLVQNETAGSEGVPEGADPELQGCADGWAYNMTEMTSTIISEVRQDVPRLLTYGNDGSQTEGEFCARSSRLLTHAVAFLFVLTVGLGL